MFKRFTVGRISTTHGLKGEVKVQSYSGETEHFSGITEFTARLGEQSRILEVERIRETGKGVIVKFASIETVDDAKALAGWELWVDREKGAPLGPEEYYTADLQGCELISSGKCVGTVERVSEGPQAGLLVVATTEKGERLVPFMHVFIGKVDIPNRSIELLADWILE